MKAQDLPFTQLLEGSKQFIIPIFQRTYSWEIVHCEQLLSDIIRVGSSESLDTHFIGSAVYIPEAGVDASTPRWLVIDGQQRITTLTLIILALKNHLAENNSEEPISAPELVDRYLKNPYKKGESAYRLLPTNTDKDTLIKLVDGKDTNGTDSTRIVENYQFFQDRITADSVEAIWKGILKLMIVDVALQQGIDNPQMIFESMNSTGKALTQADLIRNYILMGLEHEPQTRLYLEYWREMEVEFGSENYTRFFDEFMRFFLLIKTGNIKIRKGDVYDSFKAYSQGKDEETLLQEVKKFSTYYCRIALGSEPDPILAQHFHDITELKVDVCYPFLMQLYADYEAEVFDQEVFSQCLRLTESYVFRRAICEIPTNSMRQTFATLAKQLKKETYLESLQAAFSLLPSYRRFPADDEFSRKIQTRDLYNFNRRSYWLRRFENYDRKERVVVNDYTIEHIMPQNENLSSEWKTELGENWEGIQEKYLHTLGNLTLTGYNSEYGDKPFAQKRDIKNGFKDSPLRLNRGIGEEAQWNEAAINRRADKLAYQALKVWAAPIFPNGIPSKYIFKKKKAPPYTIEDHPLLLVPETRELFESVRKAIINLDNCVIEEFHKTYIAYKAEANFADILPRSKRLFISLSIPFSELDDPRGLADDITNIRHHGNGNVRVNITSLDQVPYAIGLIRQALELQL